ncbi:hypothetical protein PhaeoP75_01060 [Phaeobacter gallaeciensis]|uniref:Uncharacterized protein n=1 Tax=Phaeobacter gallaeciensis TaxID=60890 RepID=A0AAD0ECA3_9RHOB|nr:hypothetical protein Gal_01064 [Phaeobacter gallaeciensis DSM 26640]ATE92103.1 hypothetical protein PhaeoP11_01059 [Phaeobacter gallaeciensis]ATE98073.1 hypothetical protein PhaeoP73_02785 [Phaeobacter gallaeciensis]ATF00719.1 hypothetical protein PhaeoP75_01060 [Phaeobacter gallaeciensis]ATF05150.1 hypothetical protein PhaeoP63_01059 [Phaeobacter gallaeciensis]
MLNHLKPTLKLLRNRIFRCAAACPLGAHNYQCRRLSEWLLIHFLLTGYCYLGFNSGLQAPALQTQNQHDFPYSTAPLLIKC